MESGNEGIDFGIISFSLGKKHSSKFFNKKIEVGGLKFDSKLEQKIYSDIILLKNVAYIKLHERIDIVFEHKICSVLPDFMVFLTSGDYIFADAKNPVTDTPVSRLKFKLLRAQTGKKVYLLPSEMSLFLAKIERS